MKKLLLKVYLIFIKYSGIAYILDLPIFQGISENELRIKELKRKIFTDDYMMFDTYINSMRDIHNYGFGYREYVFGGISEKTIRNYCAKNNIDYVMFVVKYNNDISSLIEKRLIYRLVLNIGAVLNVISDSVLFEKYFWYNTYINEIKSCIKNKKTIYDDEYYALYVAIMHDDDKVGYLKEIYNNLTIDNTTKIL